MKSRSPKNRNQAKRLWFTISHWGPRGANSLRWVCTFSFSICGSEKTKLWRLCLAVVLIFSTSDPVTLRRKTLLFRLWSVSWNSAGTSENMNFDNSDQENLSGFYKIKDWCTMDSGNSYYSVSFLVFFIECVCSGSLIYPELYRNYGYIYICICMTNVYVPTHNRELITLLPWKFHLIGTHLYFLENG